jgi:hypothetical protein
MSPAENDPEADWSPGGCRLIVAASLVMWLVIIGIAHAFWPY